MSWVSATRTSCHRREEGDQRRETRYCIPSHADSREEVHARTEAFLHKGPSDAGGLSLRGTFTAPQANIAAFAHELAEL